MVPTIALHRQSLKLQQFGGEPGLLLGGLGTVQAIYLAFTAYLERTKNYRNLLFCMLLLMLCFRVIKSLLWTYWDLTPNWVLNLGFFAHSTTGPLLLLYTYQYVFNRKWARLDILHFLPSLFLLGITFSASLENFWYAGGYSVLLYHQTGYSLVALAIAGFALTRRGNADRHLTSQDLAWLSILAMFTFLFQAAYFSNYILGATPYYLAPIIFSVLICFLSFYALLNPEIFKNTRNPLKYCNIQLSDRDLFHYREQILAHMQEKSPFLNSNYSLNDLAGDVKLPLYIVSHIINSQFDQNFPVFINSYRVKHAQELLRSEEYSKLKIAIVAYDSGFNTLSVFNAAFKRHTGMTPSEFRKTQVNL